MYYFAEIDLLKIGLWLIYISIPILILYLGYLILTKAFEYMGFTSFEAVIIVFASFLFEFDIKIFGFSISNIYLFTYKNWRVGINMGGAIIPIIISIYLFIKKKLAIKKILIGIIIVTLITYFITTPVKNQGIVATFPYFLLPAFFASIISVILCWKDFKKAAPLAYISGTIGVLIGADFLHLHQLLNFTTDKPINAIIGGASVLDMIFITGILAVLLDGLIMFKQRTKEAIK